MIIMPNEIRDVTTLWGRTATIKQPRIETNTPDYELIAAILRDDAANIKQIASGIHLQSNELSMQKNMTLVERHGLTTLNNPILFTLQTLKAQIQNRSAAAIEKRIETLKLVVEHFRKELSLENAIAKITSSMPSEEATQLKEQVFAALPDQMPTAKIPGLTR